MTVFNGVVLYVLIWWTVLFAVLPFGTRPVDVEPESGGWQGAPARPHLRAKAVATTLIALLLWSVCYLFIDAGWVSFRSGWLALPDR